VDGPTHNQAASPAPHPAPVEARQRQIFGWFGRILPPTFFERLKDDLGIIENSCIFTLTTGK